jgi:hypothetical protein
MFHSNRMKFTTLSEKCTVKDPGFLKDCACPQRKNLLTEYKRLTDQEPYDFSERDYPVKMSLYKTCCMSMVREMLQGVMKCSSHQEQHIQPYIFRRGLAAEGID